jgi:hypothetical protein
MTDTGDEYLVHDDPLCNTGGWEEVSRYECGGTWFVNVRLVSIDPYEYGASLHDQLHANLATHQHRIEKLSDCFDFDHEPTLEELQAAIDATGFNPHRTTIGTIPTVVRTGNPTLQGNVVRINSDPVVSNTPGFGDVYEYSASENSNEFEEVYALVPLEIDERPTAIAIKDEWIHLQYVRAGSRPEQFFDTDHDLYSVRVNKTTGEVRRKVYDEDVDFTDEEYAQFDGAPDKDVIVGVGRWLDQPRVTLYYPEEIIEEGASNEFLVEVPLIGATWEHGVKIRTRRYVRESYEE